MCTPWCRALNRPILSGGRATLGGNGEGRAKCEVWIHCDHAAEHLLQGPVSAVHPPGDPTVRCRLCFADSESASDEGFSVVRRVPDVTRLCLDCCLRLTECALEAIASQDSLRKLSLASCRLAGNERASHLSR